MWNANTHRGHKGCKLSSIRISRVAIPATSILLCGASPLFAQSNPETSGLEDIIVTAQKRPEAAQSVPMSIKALDTTTLQQLHVSDFNDYLKLLTNVTSQSVGPGYTQIVMRGVSAQSIRETFSVQTNVATYFDDQAVTSELGTLDVHIYDIQRVEVLAGPQGTLFGASSEAGTLRIIPNKPDPKAFEAGFNFEGNFIAHGGAGYLAEGFANIPLSENAAIRLVGWSKRDSGYIDNVSSTRTFAVSGTCMSNTEPPSPGCITTPNLAKNDFNDSTVEGGRAALKIDLNENWTVTPNVMAQRTKYNGVFGYDPNLGDLKVAQFFPDKYEDIWYDAVLTIEGKISNFDLVFTNAYLKRDIEHQADYSDYSLAYDAYVGEYLKDDQGSLINPSQYSNVKRHFDSHSHELRISSPQEKRIRFIIGGFYQEDIQNYIDDYKIDGLATNLSVSGWPQTWWLINLRNSQKNVAAFGEIYYNVLPDVTITGGLRYFNYSTTQRGFLGPGLTLANTWGLDIGEASCFGAGYNGAPCLDQSLSTSLSGAVPKVSVAYHITPNKMVYATWSRGFSPGGSNLNAPPYGAEYLTNYELGWKTSWLNNRIRFNGSIFQEDWNNFQFNFLTQAGIGVTANAGQARIRGIESELTIAPSKFFRLSAGITALDPKTTTNYCGTLDANGNPITDCPTPSAPRGTQLPNAPKFKGNLLARFEWPVGDWNVHLQGNLVYQSSSWPTLTLDDRGYLGRLPSYTMADFAVGIEHGRSSFELFLSNAFDERAQLTRYAQCAPSVCAPVVTYVTPSQPRTIGIRYGQRL